MKNKHLWIDVSSTNWARIHADFRFQRAEVSRCWNCELLRKKTFSGVAAGRGPYVGSDEVTIKTVHVVTSYGGAGIAPRTWAGACPESPNHQAFAFGDDAGILPPGSEGTGLSCH